MTDKKVPELRFEGFKNEWEQRKLEDISKVITKGTTPRDKSWSGEVNYVKTESINPESGDIFVTANTSIEEHEGYLKRSQLKAGDVLFSIVGTLGRVGVVKDIDLPANTNQQIGIIRLSDADEKFVFNALKTPRIASFIKSDATIGAQPSLSLWQINVLEIKLPNHEEQTKIGKFFDDMDDLITLHQRKFDLLKQLKQVYLKKLFPRNSETVSELRFADFKDKWEQRKLGEIAEIVRGASPRPIQDPKWFDPNSDIGWLRISDVTEQNGRIRKLEQKISKAGQQKTRVLETPHLLLSIAATVGKPVMNYVKTGVHDGFLIFLNPEFNTEFVFQWLEMFRPKWRKYGQPGSQVNLNSELVQNQKILLPSVEEQKKIAIFFEELDKNITLHKNKLDQLKQLKSAFLQKMFI
ncbi:restriction endonuclease subunit S [Enterococcus pseudoavium]|uniref:restriction endonuclease subunit S n=1 Tax=Enterococcus pseudoavium TaxID=44007 RepID=UPI003F9A6756